MNVSFIIIIALAITSCGRSGPSDRGCLGACDLTDPSTTIPDAASKVPTPVPPSYVDNDITVIVTPPPTPTHKPKHHHKD